ncbi:hypothetical protein [Agromyces humatus]|uniref:Uncharacterized protein n=1 Tax=Agromyces humatus TaxID=279573 RepID=A0ABP4X3T5_9MICO|nr:hypothetical protein [Agromyces humatus]
MLKDRGKLLVVAAIAAVPLLSGCTGSGDGSIRTSATEPETEGSAESRNLTLPVEMMITADGEATRLQRTVALDVAVILEAPTVTQSAPNVRRDEEVILRPLQ